MSQVDEINVEVVHTARDDEQCIEQKPDSPKIPEELPQDGPTQLAEHIPKSNQFQTFCNVAKLFCGKSYTVLPHTMSLTGWLGGLLLITILGPLNAYSMHINLKAADKYPGAKNYSQLCSLALGRPGKIVVEISIMIIQLGVCISSLYFIAAQIDFIASELSDYDDKKDIYILIIALITIPTCWIETYTSLSYFSISGIFCAVIAMFMIGGSSAKRITTGDDEPGDIIMVDWKQTFGYIGVMMFIFEGNPCIMNIRREAKKPSKFPTILALAVGTGVVFFIAYSMLAYFCFKGESQDIVTFNYDASAFGIILICLISINAMTSFPVQILSAFDMIEQYPFFKSTTNFRRKLKMIISRTLVIVGMTGIALVVPNFTDFLNIAGALGSAVVVFVLPPILYLKAYWNEISKIHFFFLIFVISFGVIGGTYSIINSIQTLVTEDD